MLGTWLLMLNCVFLSFLRVCSLLKKVHRTEERHTRSPSHPHGAAVSSEDRQGQNRESRDHATSRNQTRTK